MSHHRQSTWCCEESETPRVRTIFVSKLPAAPEPTPAPARYAEPAVTPEHPKDWPGLLAAILRALLPFQDALEAARQVIRDARTHLVPAPG